MRRDGHIHTPYCPHGTQDSFSEYVEKALILGFEEISFTEHAPLPTGFVDPTPAKDSGLPVNQIEAYFREIEAIKNEYRGQIKINSGLEVDFIEGYEQATRDFLNTFGPKLDDAILSVHFLKHNHKYDCMDYSPEVFGDMVKQYGSIEAIYKKYYETLMKSVSADLGPFKPRRIGHITLAHKFQKKFPVNSRFEIELNKLLIAIKDKGYELDYNGAGTAKPLCREPYPPDWVVEQAIAMEIPLVYGSDAHQQKELGQGRHLMNIRKA